MGGEHFVLGQNAVDGSAEAGPLALLRDLSEDMVGREVGANTLADGPSLHFSTESYNFPGHVRAGDDVLLRPEGVLALRDDEVAILAGRCVIRYEGL